MNLRALHPDTDFDRIRSWITNERDHAMWCAGRFRYPLDRDNFLTVLSETAQRTGDIPFVAAADDNQAIGFLCYSPGRDSGKGKLKFVIVDPACRGKGVAQEMLRLVLSRAFADPDTKCVSLIVFSENPRAKKCYEKAGFTEQKTDAAPFMYGEESWNRCSMVTER